MVPEGETIMNLAFYVHSSGGNELNADIFKCLNDAIDNNKVSDASLFYNDVDYNPIEKKFGCFNSTDLWSFSGALLATTIGNLDIASRVVNDIKLGLLFDSQAQDNNLMSLIQAIQNFPVIVRNEQDKKEIHRITGKMPHLVNELDAEEILEVFNE